MYKISAQVEFFTNVILKIGATTLSGKMKSRQRGDVTVEFLHHCRQFNMAEMKAGNIMPVLNHIISNVDIMSGCEQSL